MLKKLEINIKNSQIFQVYFLRFQRKILKNPLLKIKSDFYTHIPMNATKAKLF
jgi:hypothetical protein